MSARERKRPKGEYGRVVRRLSLQPNYSKRVKTKEIIQEIVCMPLAGEDHIHDMITLLANRQVFVRRV